MNREKLIELIRDGRACPNEMDMFDSCYGCKYARVVDCDVERLADYLIAHGVTVQGRCHKAESVISKTGLMCTACYSDIDRDAVFCKYCGAKMDLEVTE